MMVWAQGWLRKGGERHDITIKSTEGALVEDKNTGTGTWKINIFRPGQFNHNDPNTTYFNVVSLFLVHAAALTQLGRCG